MTQTRLFHESAEEAFQSLVDALGGYKRVAADLWPAMPLDEARRRLSDCLNPSRAHKLELSEIVWLLMKGRAAGCHVAMAYLDEKCGYAAPLPVDPESEVQRLQREFIEAQRQLSKLAEAINTKLGDVAQMRRAA